MTLFKNIVAVTKPKTPKEIKSFFSDDDRIKGKKLISFEVRYDPVGTQMDIYTDYQNQQANHYHIVADFE